MLVVTFGVLFALYARPWKARDPRSRSHIGVGAFNMVRTSVYQQIGTHAAIALRPDDDIRLAKAIKQHGFAADIVRAQDMLSLEWYASAREMVRGLMKNAFAGIHYSVLLLLLSTAALLVFNVWPWIAVVITKGTERILSLVAVAGLAAMVIAHTTVIGKSPGYALLYPFGILGFIYILWRSAALALTRGAIAWRGTSYSLKSLRRAAPARPLDRVGGFAGE
jgi:hypothetical protein